MVEQRDKWSKVEKMEEVKRLNLSTVTCWLMPKSITKRDPSKTSHNRLRAARSEWTRSSFLSAFSQVPTTFASVLG